MSPLPDDGLCLSCFLVERPADRPDEVLLGRIDPAAPWGEAGGIGAEGRPSIATRWMLPSSHLLLLESPDEAVRRIATELLGEPIETVPSPRVFSETYRRPNSTARDPHWDLEFVYEIVRNGPPPAKGRMWRELEYRPVRAMAAEEFARGHQDVLALVGSRDP